MEETGYSRSQTDFSLEESLPHANNVKTDGTGDTHYLSGSVTFFTWVTSRSRAVQKNPVSPWRVHKRMPKWIGIQ